MASHDHSLGRPRRGHRVRSVMVVAAWTLFGGCSAFGSRVAPVTEPGSTTTIPPKSRQALIGDLTIEARGVQLRDLWVDKRDPDCTPLRGRFQWEEMAYYEFSAIPIACQPGPQQALNGNHGLYRSKVNATVLDELAATKTAVGNAELFVIEYVLCTQECEDIPTLVSVVTLDRRVSVDGVEYDVLNLYEENPDTERAETYDVLASLEWAPG